MNLHLALVSAWSLPLLHMMISFLRSASVAVSLAFYFILLYHYLAFIFIFFEKIILLLFNYLQCFSLLAKSTDCNISC